MSSGPPASRLRRVLRIFRFGFRLVAWPVLTAVLIFQIRLAYDGGLRLPDFAARELESRLAARGLSFHADEIRLDPAGRLAFRKVSLGLSGDGAPFATADAIAIDLKRRALLHGIVDARRIDITGLGLAVPARRSPSGADQPLLTGGEFMLARADATSPWRLDGASARILGIATLFHGQIAAPASTATGPAPADPIAEAVTAIKSALVRAAALTRITDNLPLSSVPALEIDLATDRLTLATDLPSLELNSIPGLPPVLAGARIEESSLTFSVPLSGAFEPDLADVALHLATTKITLPSLPAEVGPVEADGIDLTLRINASHLLSLNAAADLAVHRINAPDTGLPAVPLLISASWFPLGDRLSARVGTLLADSPWQLSVAGSPRDLSGSATAYGAVTSAVLELIKPRLPPHTREILTLTDPVRLALTADLAAGGKLRRATARMEAGAAVAHAVSFTRAGAFAVLEGTRLFVDDLMLVQGDNRADGTYEMDTATLAYRFLIGGRLRPMIIDGWFTEWWAHLWANFGFNGGPPAASADIAGTWGNPDITTVFVSAETTGLKLRDLLLDRVSTRVYVQGHSTDVLGFHAEKGSAVAEGKVSRVIDMATDDWHRMEFDVTSNLPPDSIPQLFGEEGREITAPMRFSVPPALHLEGVVFGPAAGKDAGRQRYTLGLVADAPFHFHDFPLDRLSVRIESIDQELALRDIRAGFADGSLTGEAIVTGPADARWLAFDANLAGAPSDTVLNRWHEFQLTRATGPASPASSPAPAAPKPLGGRLDLTLTATGPLENPLAYSGRGTAKITGADLARIRLLGLFSQLLNGLGLGFSTLNLSDADARFTLNQNTIAFEQLYFSGTSSPVEARGDYTLPDGNLAFKARVLPFDKNGSILGNTAGLVLSPFASALEVELGGTLDKPTWTFAYGPRQLLRRITGQLPPSSPSPVTDPKPEATPPPGTPEAPPASSTTAEQ